MWKQIAYRYWQVALFQVSPADTPYSPFLLSIAGLMYAVLLVAQWLALDIQPPFTPATALISALTLLLSYWLYTYLLLIIFKHPARLVQTLTTLWFCHFIIHLFALPMAFSGPLFAVSNQIEMGTFILQLCFLLLTMALSIWQLMITVFIYRQALGMGMAQGVMASLGLLAVNIIMISIGH